METLELQLKKDFYAQIDSVQAYNQDQSFSTLNLLTKEELQELGNGLDRAMSMAETAIVLKWHNVLKRIAQSV